MLDFMKFVLFLFCLTPTIFCSLPNIAYSFLSLPPPPHLFSPHTHLFTFFFNFFPPLSQFFIKDTKSSNGTFVNENRLSPSGEESGPVELKSRDIVQFGVNVNVDKKGESLKRSMPYFSKFLLLLLLLLLFLHSIVIVIYKTQAHV